MADTPPRKREAWNIPLQGSVAEQIASDAWQEELDAERALVEQQEWEDYLDRVKAWRKQGLTLMVEARQHGVVLTDSDYIFWKCLKGSISKLCVDGNEFYKNLRAAASSSSGSRAAPPATAPVTGYLGLRWQTRRMAGALPEVDEC